MGITAYSLLWVMGGFASSTVSIGLKAFIGFMPGEALGPRGCFAFWPLRPFAFGLRNPGLRDPRKSHVLKATAITKELGLGFRAVGLGFFGLGV